VLHESGLPFSVEKVNLKTKQTASGADYWAVNSKGGVPALQLDDGRVLTEGSAVIQYLADQKPESGLAPPAGTFQRYQLMEMLNYIASELHKGYSPLFNAGISADSKAAALAALEKKFQWLTAFLGDKKFLMGETFTVADAYLFTVLNWSPRVGVDLAKHPVLASYLERVAQRPKVQEALKAEGLIH
jgi:glutathione S-transferase